MDTLLTSMQISYHGASAQTKRMSVIAENIANYQNTAIDENGDPYRRKTISFKNSFDNILQTHLVQPDKISQDYNSEFISKYEPNNPFANEDGYVKMPNVNIYTELIDSKEATRAHEANLRVFELSKSMLLNAIDILS